MKTDTIQTTMRAWSNNLHEETAVAQNLAQTGTVFVAVVVVVAVVAAVVAAVVLVAAVVAAYVPAL